MKPTFESAKNAAIKALNACPLNTIWHFINRSWWFMSAYHLRLSTKAAAWAVKKHCSHCTVYEVAQVAIELSLT